MHFTVSVFYTCTHLTLPAVLYPHLSERRNGLFQSFTFICFYSLPISTGSALNRLKGIILCPKGTLSKKDFESNSYSKRKVHKIRKQNAKALLLLIPTLFYEQTGNSQSKDAIFSLEINDYILPSRPFCHCSVIVQWDSKENITGEGHFLCPGILTSLSVLPEIMLAYCLQLVRTLYNFTPKNSDEMVELHLQCMIPVVLKVTSECHQQCNDVAGEASPQLSASC